MSLENAMVIFNSMCREIVKSLEWHAHVDGYIYATWNQEANKDFKYYEIRVDLVENTIDEDVFRLHVLVNLANDMTFVTPSIESGIEDVVKYIASEILSQRASREKEILDKKYREEKPSSIVNEIDMISYNLDKEYQNG